MVRAKMVVIAFEEDNSPVQEGQKRNKILVMQPVTQGSEENKQFSKFTPTGQLHLTVTPETSVYEGDFKKGQEFFVDITPVPLTSDDVGDYEDNDSE